MRNTIKLKRNIIFFILFVFIVSCSPTESKEDILVIEGLQTDFESTTAEQLYPSLPDVNYNGDSFTFLVREWDVNGYWGTYDIYAEKENGDAINDAVYRRNRTIEEKLNINIEEVRTNDVNGLTIKSVAANDDVYGCVMPSLAGAANLASNSYLLSLDKLPYIDLNNPWWDTNTTNMSIGNRLFFTVGDLIVLDKDSIFIVMFNKTVQKNNKIEDLYNLVRSNDWTFDKFYSVIKGVTSDLNGDGEIGFEDLVGLVSSDYAINVLHYNTGETVTRKDAEDYPYFTLNNERAVLAAEKAFEIVTDKFVTILANNLTQIANPWTDGINKMFQEDRALFLLAQVTFIHRTRTMDSDFGILPSPKLDEKQEKYYTSINPVASSCIAIPVTVNDRDKTSIVLEALTAESKYTLMHAYYDITITNKMIRDSESEEMFNLILSSRVFDLGFIFNWGNLGNVPLSLYPNGGNFVSTYEKLEPAAIIEMKKTIDSFKDMDI